MDRILAEDWRMDSPTDCLPCFHLCDNLNFNQIGYKSLGMSFFDTDKENYTSLLILSLWQKDNFTQFSESYENTLKAIISFSQFMATFTKKWIVRHLYLETTY